MRLHDLARKLSFVLIGCLFANVAHAAVIIDDTVESANSWTAPGFDSDQFGNPPGTFITPTFQEGTETAYFSAAGQSITKTGGFAGHTLQHGLYTIEFAVGNYNNVGGSVVADVDFNGLNLADAISSSTPQPASGGWSLWTATWSVGKSNPNLGDTLSFSFNTGVGATNGPFDGVGSLSDNGSGFLVSFVPPAPEPSTFILASLSVIGLVVRRRGRTNRV